MKIKISSKDIKLIVKSAVMPKGKNAALPVLSYIKVVASPGAVCWQSTDLECAAVYTAGVVEESGAALIPFNSLKGLAKCAGPASRVITIESVPGNAGALAARDGVYNTVIPCGDVESYPEIPQVDAAIPALALLPEFLDGLRAVVPAVSTEETRYNLNGVHISADGMQATDGRRLHVWGTTGLAGLGQDNFIVPAPTIARVIANMADARGLALAYSKHVEYPAASLTMPEKRKQEVRELAERNADYMVEFTAGPLRLVSRCISGMFPNYKQVIPGNKAVPVMLTFGVNGTAETVAMLKGAPSGKGGCTVTFKLVPPGAVSGCSYPTIAYSYKTEIGECSGVIGLAGALCPDGFRIGLEARYLREALEGIGDYTLSLQCGTMGDACAIDAVKIEAGPFLAVIMPIRLEAEARPADAVPVAAVEVLK